MASSKKCHIKFHWFLGLTGYYRKFVKNYMTIAEPLTQLLNKNETRLSNENIVTVQSLKEAIWTTPILAMPNFIVISSYSLMQMILRQEQY